MHRVWLSIGSNIDRNHNICSALSALKNQFDELVMSQVYESKAVGFDGDPFYNLVVGLWTNWPIKDLNHYVCEIEVKHGRVRGGNKFSSRALDIDLLTYGDEVVIGEGVQVPRKEILEYAFVLLPLSEVAGMERHPMDGRTYRELWEAFESSDQPLWPVELNV
ncbi:2-amino-4-hydroxy-6-hydroxymethyldihydropteridinepyrophosphokinase [hydrothermal vent metagenome]|uniref:2-amino-4-hydroxy-6-hydroxymethyldihydropteridine diphosphokinase n=1 Tax=hydrothermal vent metagenome TaxID=652676 RepID=A0A3B1B7Y5_9ZZZZ